MLLVLEEKSWHIRSFELSFRFNTRHFVQPSAGPAAKKFSARTPVYEVRGVCNDAAKNRVCGTLFE